MVLSQQWRTVVFEYTKSETPSMIKSLKKVIKRMRYPLDVVHTCVRCYVAYPLSLGHIEEVMAERGVVVDHATVHRRAIKILPVLAGGVPTA